MAESLHFHLPTQDTSSESSFSFDDNNDKDVPCPVIVNMHSITDLGISSFTAISVPSIIEYNEPFYLPSLDSSSTSSSSSYSSDCVIMSPPKITQSVHKRQILYSPDSSLSMSSIESLSPFYKNKNVRR